MSERGGERPSEAAILGALAARSPQPTAAVPKPAAVQNMWAYAAGYSDFAQVWRDGKPGPLLMLFEAGATVYDHGIKLAPVAA